MTLPYDPNNKDIGIDQTLFGYCIENIMALNELDGVFYRLRHQATGARHIHISTRDRENTFGVTFKTVPTDSTGVAHILEHTVLCGSRKYPVRDPFFSMLKRSLSTFMNAFTASDWTMYPFSTQNANDFYNLMDIYLDAAFFPKLAESSFKQEGHRLEIVTEPNPPGNEELALMGVVYNEMKGAMSSADQVMARSLLDALYPDTTYRHNSGGEPSVIPDLTHAQLKAFHQRHYHPSNAYFYTYGNLPLRKHLAEISKKILDQFTSIDPHTQVPHQPRWTMPKTARYTYAIDADEKTERKSQVCLAWLTCGIHDTFEVLVLLVLEQILLGNAASPLRKALMDSGLGSTLSDGTGFDADNRDTMFTCGLKDVDEGTAASIEGIIFKVLHNLVADGLDHEMIDSAIHQIEFHRKEITNTPYPYGIKLLLRMIGTWLHDGECERILQLDNDFSHLRDKINSGRFLEERIKTYFLDNPHRVLLTLVPDPSKAQAEDEKARRRLKDRWNRLTAKDKSQITRETENLRQLQETQENIDCLPTLALSDIPPQVSSHAPSKVFTDLPLWCYTQPTSGILYFNAVAGASDIPRELLPWVPFFCYAFSKIGTTRHDYVEMAGRIDAVTGGLGLGAQARVLNRHPGTCLPLVTLSAKCLNRNLSPMVAIVEELIAEVDFGNLERLKQLLGEYRSALESAIVHNGHRLAVSLSARSFGPANTLNEMWNGVHQIRSLRSFDAIVNNGEFKQLAADLAIIAKRVFDPQNVILAAIGEAEIIDAAKQEITAGAVLSAYQRNHRRNNFQLFDLKTEPTPPHEGWSTSSAVSFVAQTLPTVGLGHEDAPVLAVLSKMLHSLYLHREIREKGGAYGGLAIYSPENGLFSLASYRDPHIVRTLDVFAGVSQFITSGVYSNEDVKEAILQVCAEIDRPDPPGPAARKDFFRLIMGISPQERQNYKQSVLKTTLSQIMATTDRYFKSPQLNAGVAVIAGAEQLEKANAQLAQNPLKLHKI